MSGINVTISSTSPGVSISGGTAVSVAVSGTPSPVSVSLLPSSSASLPDITQLTAGAGITISTAANQFTISGYTTAQLASYSPVASINGRTGTVMLQAVDLTAAAATHTHSTADVVGLTAFLGSSAPVQSVAGRTGVITLATSDISGLAPVAASGSASDLSTGTIPAGRLPAATTTALGAIQVGSGLAISSGVLSATSGASGPPLSNATPQALGTAAAGTSSDASRADHVHAMPAAASISGLSPIALSGSASDLSSGTVPVAALPAATTATLGAIKVGSGLSISSGVLSASGGGGGGATFVSAPTSAVSAGTAGTFASDSSYLYACYSASNWLRVQRAGWQWTPSVPLFLNVTAERAGTSSEVSPVDAINASWVAPSDNGGGLSGYLLSLNSGATATVSANTLTYAWPAVTAAANACTTYNVDVKAFNAAGTSVAATSSAVSPNTIYPTGFNVSQTPNEGAPGVTYSASWVVVCVGSYNRYELQVRLYDVENGAESNWETVGTPTSNSFTHYISTASSTTQYEWRVRAIYFTNGQITTTSLWAIDSTP